MTERTGLLAEEFATQRRRLHAIAFRMLGSHWDADDAVQETWIRLQNSDPGGIDNLDGWLTTVTSRICLDLLRRMATRREDLGADLPETNQSGAEELPDGAAVGAEDVGMALLVVLDELAPQERLAFVLHDVFGLAFRDIAPIVERTPQAARQLASRARRRVAGVDARAEHGRRRDAVDAFLKASRDGDFGGLLQVLDPEIRVRADDDVLAASARFVTAGAPTLTPSLAGADAVARAFAGRATQVRHALIEGVPGAVYASGGVVSAAYIFHLQAGRISRIEIIGSPERLDSLAVTAVQA